jgi:hypothetical protein
VLCYLICCSRPCALLSWPCAMRCSLALCYAAWPAAIDTRGANNTPRTFSRHRHHSSLAARRRPWILPEWLREQYFTRWKRFILRCAEYAPSPATKTLRPIPASRPPARQRRIYVVTRDHGEIANDDVRDRLSAHTRGLHFLAHSRFMLDPCHRTCRHMGLQEARPRRFHSE